MKNCVEEYLGRLFICFMIKFCLKSSEKIVLEWRRIENVPNVLIEWDLFIWGDWLHFPIDYIF